MNTFKKYLAALAASLFGFLVAAHAEVPADVTSIATDATSVFGSMKTLVLSVVAFGALIWAIKKYRTR